MIARAKSVLSTLGTLGAVAIYLVLAIAVLALFFLAVPFLAAAANFLAAISYLFVIPLLTLPLLLKRTRRFCGNALVVLSYVLGASAWLTATLWLKDLWGGAAVVVGVLMFGIGSVPLGCLALLLHAKFAVFFTLLAQLATVYILRILGFWIESKAPPPSSTSFTESPAITAEHWLLEGRRFYDLAETQEWNPAKAFGCFENGLRANPDNTELHVYLGMMYSDGEGVSQDYVQALKHFSVAAELGDSNAQRSLGEMYDEGLGVIQNRERAAIWYRRAADQGDSYAQCRLGFFYSRDPAFTKDFTQAFGWYTKAAQAGDAAAQVALGDMYAEGVAVEPDLAQAAYWYSKAAALGDKDAQAALARSAEFFSSGNWPTISRNPS